MTVEILAAKTRHHDELARRPSIEQRGTGSGISGGGQECCEIGVHNQNPTSGTVRGCKRSVLAWRFTNTLLKRKLTFDGPGRRARLLIRNPAIVDMKLRNRGTDGSCGASIVSWYTMNSLPHSGLWYRHSIVSHGHFILSIHNGKGFER